MVPELITTFPLISVQLKDGSRAAIRPLSDGDGEALAVFYAGVPLDDIRFYCPHPLDREHALCNAAKAYSPTEVVLVLDTAGGIGGYAWYRWSEGDALSGFGICISRAFQGQGVGRLLMTRLLEIAETVGPPVMTLTVQRANARAVQLYQSMGFQVVREQIRQHDPALGFPEEPEFYMERRVR